MGRLCLFLFVGWLSSASNGLAQPGLPLGKWSLLSPQEGLPQGFVPSIAQDATGYVYFATKAGLARYDGRQFRVFQPRLDGASSISGTSLDHLHLDPQGYLWIVSEASNLDRFDPRTERFWPLSRQPLFRRSGGERILISNLCSDRRQNLWIVTNGQGLLRLDSGRTNLTRYRRNHATSGGIPSDTVNSLLVDRQGRYWLASKAGLGQFDPATGQYHPVPLESPHNECLLVHERANGQLLVGCADRLLVVDPDQKKVLQAWPQQAGAKAPWLGWAFARDANGNDFVLHHGALYRYLDGHGLARVDGPFQSLSLRTLFIDRTQTLWIGSDGKGIIRVNQTVPAFASYTYQPVNHSPYAALFQRDALSSALNLPSDRLPEALTRNDPYLMSYTLDGRGRLWIGGYDVPVFWYDFATFQFGYPDGRALPAAPRDSPWARWPGRLAHTPLTTDERGDVWCIPNPETLARYDVRTGRFAFYPLKFPPELLPAGHRPVPQFSGMAVRQGRLVLATVGQGLLEWHAGKPDVQRWYRHSADPATLSSNNILHVRFDPRRSSWLWAATLSGGLCRLDLATGRCRRFTVENGGMPDNTVYGVLPGSDGHLWLGTNRGLCRFDARTNRWVLFTEADGLPGNEFNRHHFFTLPDGRIALGGLEGYVLFDPRRIRPDTVRPSVRVNELRINNQPVRADSLAALRRLDLRHDQNFLTVGFAALYFNAPDKLRYRYQLTGIDRGWVVTDQPTATYTALRPGRYTLRLAASNTSGRWSDRVLELPVVIRPPWWATWWAYLLYLALAAGAAYLLLRNRLNRLRMQQAVALREKEAEGLRALDEAKSRFFTNLTHEFRTPLTLILTPVEQWLAEADDPRDRQRLGSVQRHARRLLHLINQLLDLARLDADRLPVLETEGDPAELLERVAEGFRETATRKGLALAFRADDVPAWGQFDAAKWETIAHNLIGNAVKFTDRGRIDVTLTNGENHLVLRVADTGPGIPAEAQARLFERFYQVDASATRAHEGTGIGLALVRELVELLGGGVGVESRVGQGTTFTVRLPFQPAAGDARPGDGFAEEPHHGLNGFAPTLPDEPANGQDAGVSQKTRLLVVDDNAELAAYLAESLAPKYRVRTASNGAEALRLALDEMPDLVVSDVMMPGMDGYELCRRLKTDDRTAHLAVVLLTAKAAQTSRLEGLSLGADDYLTKPFSLDELRLRLHNLTERQARLREFFRKTLLAPPPPDAPAEAHPPADPLLHRLYDLLDARLDDPTLGVDALADALAMSRASLHRKLVSLTGLAPTELVRQHRLRRAVELLRQGLNVSETATRVGFDSPAYFTRRFREAYGQPPTAFAKG